MVAQSLPAEYLDRPQNGFEYLTFNNPGLGVSESYTDGIRQVTINDHSPLVENASIYHEAIADLIQELQRRNAEFHVEVLVPAIENSKTFNLSILDKLDDVPIHPFMHISDDTDLDFVNRNITDRFKGPVNIVAQRFGMQPRELYRAIAPFFAYYEQDGKRYIVCLKLR